MDTPRGIIIFGAGGAGKTTLGREVARLLEIEHFDTDDYFFEKTDPPFTKQHPLQKRVALLRNAIKGDFVITGCLREWGGAFDDMLSLAVFLLVPTDVRLERLEKREYKRYGDRIKPGGDLHDRHQSFIKYVTSYDTGGMETRSHMSQEAWADGLTCPVIKVDGAIDYRINAKNIASNFWQNKAGGCF
ncbi:MAG: AAA family ATPase [Defluviitaleaceae bacterium]|nr:AAA family ATPase [Defluviitaleaceae bacterium]